MEENDRLEVLPKIPGLEPEEAPARHVTELPFTVRVAPSPFAPAADQRIVSRSRVPITAEMTAGEAADRLSSRCYTCAHFRNDLWKSIKKNWADSPLTSDRRHGLIKMVEQFARSVTDSDPTFDDLIKASAEMEHWGVCSALTEEKKDLTLVHPGAGCPEPFDFYQDRSLPARREASATFDAILMAAQGRKR